MRSPYMDGGGGMFGWAMVAGPEIRINAFLPDPSMHDRSFTFVI